MSPLIATSTLLNLNYLQVYFLFQIKNKLKLYKKLNYFLRDKNIIYDVPAVKTVSGEKRLSRFLTIICLLCFKNSFYLNFIDLKNS